MTRKTVIAFIFALSFIFTSLIFAPKAQAVFDCLTLTTSSSQPDKDYCRSELTQIEAQLTDLLNQQKEQQKTTGTLKGDVDYLTSKINALKTKIKARALIIAQLKVNIAEKVNTIKSLSDKIDREHESLAQLLRNTNEFDEEVILYLILSDSNISNFYSDLESYTSIKQAIKASIDIINGIKVETEVAKIDLEKKQNAETDAKAELESAQKTIAKSEADKKQLLDISKQKESAYQQLAAQKKAQADRIRSALFSLAGVSKKIEFGTALQYANEAEAKTGIPPAFLLAIITQESSLGTDTGSCYLTDSNTGSGISSKSGKIFRNLMRPRDVPVFLTVVNSLSLDPYKTLVSCPIGGSGYGGAMGPAQFIAATWAGIKAKLAVALGISNPNPWEPRHAFMASAIFLSELGANDSYSSQIKAACKYYGTGGSTCSYGRSVMSKISKIQSNIDALN